MLRCSVTQQVVEWHELCLSKLYFIYMICISMFSCFPILVRNVINHSSCAICVWILWWSRTLCSWEQIVRRMTMENLMLKNAGTQCSDRMSHWDISFYINCMKSWTTLFWAEMILLFSWASSIMMLEKFKIHAKLHPIIEALH